MPGGGGGIEKLMVVVEDEDGGGSADADLEIRSPSGKLRSLRIIAIHKICLLVLCCTVVQAFESPSFYDLTPRID